MDAIWTFEDGRLMASDEAGKLLRQWAAEETMGLPLAAALNQAQSLSRLFLWPLLNTEKETTD